MTGQCKGRSCDVSLLIQDDPSRYSRLQAKDFTKGSIGAESGEDGSVGESTSG